METRIHGKRKQKLQLRRKKEKKVESKATENKANNQTMDKYLKALNIYFKLKKKYDSRLKKLKQKILKKDVSWNEKREEFERRITCLKCDKKGGTLFNYEDGIYTAVCGNSANPCELNIEFKRPKVIFIPDEINEIKDILEIVKQNIIQQKLNLVFNLEDESAVTAKFNEFRDGYRDGSKHLRVLIENLNESLNIEQKETTLHKAKQQFYTTVGVIKKLLNEYKDDNDTAKLNEAVQFYINDIIPLQKLIRENQYAVMEVIGKKKSSFNPTMYRLVKQKVRRQDQELVEEKPKVIQFKINVKKRKKAET